MTSLFRYSFISKIFTSLTALHVEYTANITGTCGWSRQPRSSNVSKIVFSAVDVTDPAICIRLRRRSCIAGRIVLYVFPALSIVVILVGSSSYIDSCVCFVSLFVLETTIYGRPLDVTAFK